MRVIETGSEGLDAPSWKVQGRMAKKARKEAAAKEYSLGRVTPGLFALLYAVLGIPFVGFAGGLLYFLGSKNSNEAAEFYATAGTLVCLVAGGATFWGLVQATRFLLATGTAEVFVRIADDGTLYGFESTSLGMPLLNKPIEIQLKKATVEVKTSGSGAHMVTKYVISEGKKQTIVHDKVERFLDLIKHVSEFCEVPGR